MRVKLDAPTVREVIANHMPNEIVELLAPSVKVGQFVEHKNTGKANRRPRGPTSPDACSDDKPPVRRQRPAAVIYCRECSAVRKRQESIKDGDHASSQPGVRVAGDTAWTTESLWELTQRHASYAELRLYRHRMLLADTENVHSLSAVAGVDRLVGMNPEQGLVGYEPWRPRIHLGSEGRAGGFTAHSVESAHSGQAGEQFADEGLSYMR